jgi:hypothetical protein
MKKIVLLILIALPVFVFCQDAEDKKTGLDPFERAYSPGKNYFNVGMNFLYNDFRPNVLGLWSNYNYRFGLPPLVASLEHGFHEHFSAGVYAGFRSYGWDYRTAAGSYDYSFRRFNFGVRGSFHYVHLLNEIIDLGLEEDHFDFYATLLIGVSLISESVTEPSLRETNVNTGAFVGTLLGFRYMFNNNFGAYLEGGWGSLGFANIGITLKF